MTRKQGNEACDDHTPFDGEFCILDFASGCCTTIRETGMFTAGIGTIGRWTGGGAGWSGNSRGRAHRPAAGSPRRSGPRNCWSSRQRAVLLASKGGRGRKGDWNREQGAGGGRGGGGLVARADCCYVGRGSRETKSGRKEANQGAEVKRRSPFAHAWPLSCPPQQQPSALAAPRKAWCSGKTLTVLTDTVAACVGLPPPEPGPASVSKVGCSGTWADNQTAGQAV